MSGYDNIAGMVNNAHRGTDLCPLCGVRGPHQHKPEELVIFKNGMKYAETHPGHRVVHALRELVKDEVFSHKVATEIGLVVGEALEMKFKKERP